MNNNLPIDDLLREITAAEGEGFVFDREAILKDLEEQRSAFTNPGVSLLSIVGGVLTAVCFIVFMLFTGGLQSGESMVVIGLVLIAGSVGANKVTKTLLLDTATIAFYLTGFGLLMGGLFQLHFSDTVVALYCLVLSVAVLFISGSAKLVFSSVLIANGSLLSLVLTSNVYNAIHVYVAFLVAAFTYMSLHQAKMLTHGKTINQRYHPVRAGLLLSLLATLVLLTHADELGTNMGRLYIASIIIITAILLSVWHISRKLLITENSKLVTLYGVSLLVLWPTFFSPAISGAFLIILLSFYTGYKGGFISGVLALVYFISWYYYDLQFTLLTKSIVLMGSGVSFLILFALLKKQLQTA